jgi:predicted O-methyltransferase YrrM
VDQELWNAVDGYIADHLLPADLALSDALATCVAADLPPIGVAPNQGKLLMLLARMQGAHRILEIGTLGGYSTIWLARGLARDGRLISLEVDPKHAAVARENLARAGFAGQVDVQVGPALETLAELVENGCAPFDLIFIDADKETYAEYLQCALRLSRLGTLIIADNVVRKGAVTDPASDDARVQGIRRFYERLAAEPCLTATAIQTVGSKGYDGFAIALVTTQL